jgi:hypothetical protein
MKLLRLLVVAIVLCGASACESAITTFPECDPTTKGSGTC